MAMPIRNGDAVLFGLFSLAAATIVGLAWFLPDRYLSGDGSAYLLLADLLAHGRHFPGEHVALATWPLGYPLLIALSSLVTGLDAFWASKVTNIALVGGVFVVLRASFGTRAPAYAATFLTASMLTILTNTWSEVPFVAALVLLALALRRFNARPTVATAALVAATCFAVFLSRYIGLFAVGAVGVTALWHLLRHDRRGFVLLTAAAALAAALALTYLAANAARLGHSTGIPRIANHTPLPALLGDLLLAQVFELNPLRLGFSRGDWAQIALWVFGMSTALAFAAAVLRQHRANPATSPAKAPAWGYFLLVGGLYWLAIVAMRMTFWFDDFSYRLIGPSTPLLAMAAIDLAAGRVAAWALVARGMPILAAMAVLLNVPSKLVHSRQAGYLTYVEQQERLHTLPAGSVLLMGDPLAAYLRPDVHLVLQGSLYAGATIDTVRADFCGKFPAGVFRDLIAESSHPGLVPRPGLIQVATCPVGPGERP